MPRDGAGAPGPGRPGRDPHDLRARPRLPLDRPPPGRRDRGGRPRRARASRSGRAIPERYARLQWRLALGGTLTSFEEEDFVRESVNSNDLYAYLGAERDRYWYAFIPYCFGTTWEGALVAPERSLLIPCLHDEPFAQLKWTRRVLRAVRAVCFHVPAERALAESLAGADAERFHLVGEGVDAPPPGDGERFRRTHRVLDPFLLYAGRKAAEKNTPLLVEYFARYKLTHPGSRLKLVLIGSGRRAHPAAPVRRHPRPRVRPRRRTRPTPTRPRWRSASRRSSRASRSS